MPALVHAHPLTFKPVHCGLASETRTEVTQHPSAASSASWLHPVLKRRCVSEVLPAQRVKIQADSPQSRTRTTPAWVHPSKPTVHSPEKSQTGDGTGQLPAWAFPSPKAAITCLTMSPSFVKQIVLNVSLGRARRARCSSDAERKTKQLQRFQRYMKGVEYFIVVRSLQTCARQQNTSHAKLTQHILAVTPEDDMRWLSALVRASRRKTYKSRRWAPIRPMSSAVLLHAQEPGLHHGDVLKRIIISRIFAVTSARLMNWQTPCG